ncbi:MAG: matrixin family metalloprotease [Dehalococcoidia bacterium]|nr:matrixin family metalloprotease [Dehalococcoidia bacterium]
MRGRQHPRHRAVRRVARTLVQSREPGHLLHPPGGPSLLAQCGAVPQRRTARRRNVDRHRGRRRRPLRGRLHARQPLGDQNGVNEVAFDDERDVVQGSAAAVAHGTWLNQPRFGVPTSREFVEFDIIVDHTLDVPLVCPESVVTHETGHALGFGHSDSPADLMYHAFNPNDLGTCPGTPSPEEARALQQLYGVNRAPAFPPADGHTVPLGAPASLSLVATDPEGDTLTYTWEQVGGQAVSYQASGSTLHFTAPDTEGARLQFRVTALDRFLHAARAVVDVTIGTTTAGGLPTQPPSLAAFVAGPDAASLNWESTPGATTYRFCTGVSGAPPADCEDLPDASVAVAWDTVLGAPGPAEDRRIFTSGARTTSMAGCGGTQCTAPGEGPLAGGLQWAAWDIDYDYLAMAYDVRGTSVRFTIGAVANISGEARRFTVYSGTASGPLARRIHACGEVAAGQVCFALLGPRDRDHLSTVTIVSERPGTPITEHRVTVR